MANYRIIAPSAYLPVTVAEMKIYLGIDAAYTAKDAQIQSFILSAKDYVERYTKRRIGDVEVEETFDVLPADLIFVLSLGVVEAASVDVAYWDGSTWALLSPTDFYVDAISTPCRVEILSSAFDQADRKIARWKIAYKAGTAAATDVPAALVTQIKLLVAFWNENTTDQDITDLNYINTILKQYVLNR